MLALNCRHRSGAGQASMAAAFAVVAQKFGFFAEQSKAATSSGARHSV